MYQAEIEPGLGAPPPSRKGRKIGVVAARFRHRHVQEIDTPAHCVADAIHDLDEDRYVLVTPVERVGIKVDDAPFLAVELTLSDASGAPTLTFRTNVEDFVAVDKDHPLRFEPGASEGLKPYVLVRGGLWALVKRALFCDLAAMGETRRWEWENWFGVVSSGIFIPMTKAAALEGL